MNTARVETNFVFDVKGLFRCNMPKHMIRMVLDGFKDPYYLCFKNGEDDGQSARRRSVQNN